MYSLKITTWENDADNYNTHEIRSEDRGYIKFLIEVASLFYSEYSDPKDSKKYFGNSDVGGWQDESSELYAAINEIVHKYVRANVSLNDDWIAGLESNDIYMDLLYDEVGIQTWCEGEYWRVFESFQVEILPSDVKDVTQEIKEELKKWEHY